MQNAVTETGMILLNGYSKLVINQLNNSNVKKKWS